MLPGMTGLRVLITSLLVSSAGLLCAAQPVQPAAVVRYHFGDDPDGKLGWASPNFDDSGWPVGKDGKWPMPAFYSDGIVWVRARVPVPSDASGPLAVRISNQTASLIADELYVNGVRVGHQGGLPPQTAPIAFGRGAVFDLPPAVVERGVNAVVAFRAWYPPGARSRTGEAIARFAIDESRDLHLAERADHSASVVQGGPNLALNGIIFLLGAGLLAFWRWAGGRDLMVCSWMLMATSLMPLWSASVILGLAPVPWWAYSIGYSGLQALSMAATVELVWTVHGLRALGLKRVYQATWVIGNAAFLTLSLTVKPSPIVSWSYAAMMSALFCFDSIQLAVNLWALIARTANRLIAVALIAIPVTDLLQNFGSLRGIRIGQFYETYFDLSLFLCEFALFAMLARRAWQAWRTRDELRVEFDAARQLQQHLVAPAVDVPGFKVESAYLPAKQVGGDFFRVLPDEDGSVLVVVGDVSGKGLKAALTVSAVMGALPGCRSRKPAEVLAHLNQALYGQVDGFATCCVALIEKDGAMTLANAGNPAPYRNGEEMAVEAGLPLGILANASYGETRYTIAAGDRLTFVSDGVVEATNAKGELYGFERTRAISADTAERVARAAQDFGQEDDITVLSVMRTAALA
jgi:Stage II sporulation protein E (SpoIIE)